MSAKESTAEETQVGARGDNFQTATGKQVANIGSRRVQGRTEHGSTISMNYAVADIAVPLDSVSQICDAGATVTFTKSGGWIDLPNTERLEFHRKDNTYVRRVWVALKPFSGPVQPQDPCIT